jgi:hypothetical protein
MAPPIIRRGEVISKMCPTTSHQPMHAEHLFMWLLHLASLERCAYRLKIMN